MYLLYLCIFLCIPYKICDKNYMKTAIVCKPLKTIYMLKHIVFSQLFLSNSFLLSKKNTFEYYRNVCC